LAQSLVSGAAERGEQKARNPVRLEIVTKKRWWGTRWWIRIKGANGEIIMHGESMASHQKAQETANEVAKAAHVGLPVREVTE
jgi:uncharacterized protein YegP (UPF0339 family)